MSRRSDVFVGMLSNLRADENADAGVAAVARADLDGLTRIGMAWWQSLGEVAKSDPAGAARLASTMVEHAAHFAPDVRGTLGDLIERDRQGRP
jgi:hypothetical protein